MQHIQLLLPVCYNVAMKENHKKELGALGERIAADYLRKRGYRIREMNARTPQGEIDIVAQDGKALVFVEVRTRQGTAYGTPEESIDRRKQQKLVLLAEQYIQNITESFSSYRIDAVLVEFTLSSVLKRVDLIKSAVEP